MDLNSIKWVGLGFMGLALLKYLSLINPKRVKSDVTPTNYGIEYKKVTFLTEDGLKLAGWWVPGNTRAKGTIIVGHGYPFDKANIFEATEWLHPEFNLFYYDHRSFGDSEGKYTTGGIKEVKDIEAAIKYVKNKQTKPIGLYGYSMSAAAMLMAPDDDVKAIVADSSYATVDHVLNHMFPRLISWPFAKLGHLCGALAGVDLDKSPLEAIKNKKVPVLLLHGELDEQVPVENTELLYKAAKGKTLFISLPNVNHNFVVDDSMKKTIKKFFKESF